MCDLIKHDALLWLVVFQQLWSVHFDPCWSGICSLGGPLSHDSPVVVFFDRGHPHFWNFDSTIPVDVVRVKSYVNCLFDPCKSLISKDRNAPIRAVEKQLITAEHHALQNHLWPVDLIVWRGLAVCSRDVAIYITRDYIVRHTKNLAFKVDCPY